MSHLLVKTIVIPTVIELIEKRFNCSEEKAISDFYKSTTAKLLSDDSTGFYGQSALYIFGEYLNEKGLSITASYCL